MLIDYLILLTIIFCHQLYLSLYIHMKEQCHTMLCHAIRLSDNDFVARPPTKNNGISSNSQECLTTHRQVCVKKKKQKKNRLVNFYDFIPNYHYDAQGLPNHSFRSVRCIFKLWTNTNTHAHIQYSTYHICRSNISLGLYTPIQAYYRYIY